MYKIYISNSSMICHTAEASGDKGGNGILVKSLPQFKDLLKSLEELQLNLVLQFRDKDQLFHYLKCVFEFHPAAGGVVRNEKEELLLIYRKEHWEFPKGHLERNESIKECALREVKEETHLKEVVLVRDLPSTYHCYYLKSQRVLKQTFWFEMKAASNQVLKAQKDEGISEVRWFRKEEMQEIRNLMYPSNLDLLKHL